MYAYKLGFILSGKAREFKVGGAIPGCMYYSKDDNTEYIWTVWMLFLAVLSIVVIILPSIQKKLSITL